LAEFTSFFYQFSIIISKAEYAREIGQPETLWGIEGVPASPTRAPLPVVQVKKTHYKNPWDLNYSKYLYAYQLDRKLTES
jgi:hypothetical protein